MAKMWGARFTKKIDPLMEEFSKSIQYDYKLAQYDLLGSMIHVEILKKSGYLTSSEALKLHNQMDSLYADMQKGTYTPSPKSEDIHTDIQDKLQKKLGDLVLKLHTARSRNDQVAFATKLYCKAAIASLIADTGGLCIALEKTAHKHKNIVIPGFTHMQHAQPVFLKDYFLAYAQMLKRDVRRLDCINENMELVMGAGALAGTPIDAAKYASALKFVKATVNSLDSVSDRDFVIEIISALSLVAMHLSRMSEDLIIWSTKEFDFVEIDEAFCTGSSLMPQKKNSDALELIRGYSGRIYGNLVSVLTMMKGLPLTYNRDMQLDKEPLFNSFEIISAELQILSGIIKTLKFNEAKIKEQLQDESLYATDLVYYLVDKKIPFKDAHSIVGRLVKYSLDNEIEIKDMPEHLLKKFCAKFVKKEIVKLFDPLVSVKAKKSIKR